ncbi:hypothetical protein FB451DRAFT_1396596 [Mycena latifolia]|nr:hypothetical protein FB451DRAFT_1396596 [Mycena latifolia]
MPPRNNDAFFRPYTTLFFSFQSLSPASDGVPTSNSSQRQGCRAAAAAAAPPTGGTRSRTVKTEREPSNRKGKSQAKSKTPKVPLEKAGSPPPVPQVDPPAPKAKRASGDSASTVPAATPGTPRMTRDILQDTVSDQLPPADPPAPQAKPASKNSTPTAPAAAATPENPPWRLSEDVAHIASGGYFRPRPGSSTHRASPESGDDLQLTVAARHWGLSLRAGDKAQPPASPPIDDVVDFEEGAGRAQTPFLEEPEDGEAAGGCASTPSVQHDSANEEDAGGDLSDGGESNFSTTDAAERKEADRQNKVFEGLPWVAQTVPIEEQDEEDMERFEEEAEAELARKTKRASVGKSTGKGKGKGKDDDDAAEGVATKAKAKGKGKAKGNEDDDDDVDTRAGDYEDPMQEDDPQDQPPWELTPGQMSKEDLEEALAARRQYHATVQTVAHRLGKKMATVFKAVGDGAATTRHTNPWNAFQTKYRAEKPKRADVSANEYRQELSAAYAELFVDLPEEDRNNPDEQRKCVKEVMEWYHENSMVLLDERKAGGNAHALMSKIVKPFIHQSTVAGSTYDVEVFGFGIDTFSNVAIIWGGTPTFYAIYEAFEQPIKSKLAELKAMFQVTNMKRRDGEVGHRPMHIDFGKRPTETTVRDAKRWIIGGCFLNDIFNVLADRDEEERNCPEPTKMSWKWADSALRYGLRLEGWPNALKAAFPAPGFDLTHIKGKEGNEALIEMCAQMQKRYLSADNTGDGPIIVSWTEEECDFNTAETLTEVAIVVADDGTVLLRADASKLLIHAIVNEKKAAEKAAAEQEAAEAAEKEAARPKKRKTPASASAPAEGRKSKKTKHIRSDDGDNEMPPPPPAAGPSSRPAVEPLKSRYTCSYVSADGERSGYWGATGMRKYKGEPTKAQQAMECWDEGTASWHTLPWGLEMIEDQDYAAECACIRMWYGLEED